MVNPSMVIVIPEKRSKAHTTWKALSFSSSNLPKLPLKTVLYFSESRSPSPDLTPVKLLGNPPVKDIFLSIIKATARGLAEPATACVGQ
ncbi:hypothetical protein Barb6_03193 [Bacteroidales bacterium Barb6]|nr:hypothetical protein Barb6_03193 [Bacteroidales bacterium Barb6]